MEVLGIDFSQSGQRKQSTVFQRWHFWNRNKPSTTNTNYRPPNDNQGPAWSVLAFLHIQSLKFSHADVNIFQIGINFKNNAQWDKECQLTRTFTFFQTKTLTYSQLNCRRFLNIAIQQALRRGGKTAELHWYHGNHIQSSCTPLPINGFNKKRHCQRADTGMEHNENRKASRPRRREDIPLADVKWHMASLWPEGIWPAYVGRHSTSMLSAVRPHKHV